MLQPKRPTSRRRPNRIEDRKLATQKSTPRKTTQCHQDITAMAEVSNSADVCSTRKTQFQSSLNLYPEVRLPDFQHIFSYSDPLPKTLDLCSLTYSNVILFLDCISAVMKSRSITVVWQINSMFSYSSTLLHPEKRHIICKNIDPNSFTRKSEGSTAWCAGSCCTP